MSDYDDFEIYFIDAVRNMQTRTFVEKNLFLTLVPGLILNNFFMRLFIFKEYKVIN